MSAPRLTEIEHRAVMVEEVIEVLKPAAGEVFVDGTFGGGGHSRALLGAAACVVWGIDRDPAAVALGRAEAAKHGGRLHVIEGAFGDMEALLAEHGVACVDGVAPRPRAFGGPARRSPARFLLPGRRPARHAHGASGSDGGRAGQRGWRVRAGRHHPPLRRGTGRAANRPRDRGGAKAGADSPHGRARAHRRRCGARHKRRYPSGDPHLPGDPYLDQQRARRGRRAGTRAGRGRTSVAALAGEWR